MNSDSVILVTGASGLVGKNLALYLKGEGYKNVLTPDTQLCDLTNAQTTLDYFRKHNPSHVFHMAGYVRGLMGNLRSHGEFWLKNTLININVIEASRQVGVKKIVAMGTVAMYPDPLPCNPLTEEVLWSGSPHNSEYGYAMAKRGMLAQLEAYRKTYDIDYAIAISTNLYGPHDRFNIEVGHVIPSLIKKFCDAKKNNTNVKVWGDGSAQRDFLYVGDAARALHLIMNTTSGPINLVTGKTHAIRDAVAILARHTGLEDRIQYDQTMPSGQMLRAYDASRLEKIGFQCQFEIDTALPQTYDWFEKNQDSARIL